MGRNPRAGSNPAFGTIARWRAVGNVAGKPRPLPLPFPFPSAHGEPSSLAPLMVSLLNHVLPAHAGIHPRPALLDSCSGAGMTVDCWLPLPPFDTLRVSGVGRAGRSLVLLIPLFRPPAGCFSPFDDLLTHLSMSAQRHLPCTPHTIQLHRQGPSLRWPRSRLLPRPFQMHFHQ